MDQNEVSSYPFYRFLNITSISNYNVNRCINCCFFSFIGPVPVETKTWSIGHFQLGISPTFRRNNRKIFQTQRSTLVLPSCCDSAFGIFSRARCCLGWNFSLQQITFQFQKSQGPWHFCTCSRISAGEQFIHAFRLILPVQPLHRPELAHDCKIEYQIHYQLKNQVCWTIQVDLELFHNTLLENWLI